MRFEVQYPTGSTHQVELQGTVVVLGREPSCDLVLNDPKCSRRHAVVEAGPQGISIRDTGSANGVFVNGQKVERANLREGDIVRLGEVVLKVLPEDMPGTLVMAVEEIEPPSGAPPAVVAARPTSSPPPAPPAPAPEPRPSARPPASVPSAPSVPARPASPPPTMSPPVPPARKPAVAAAPAVPRPRPEARPSIGPMGAIRRPLTITVLAVLWLVSALLYLAGGLGTAASQGWKGTPALAGIALGVALALVGGLMGFGLWRRSPWARILQIILAGMGLLTCAFFPTAATILAYMLRSDTRIHFSGRRDLRDLPPQDAERIRQGAGEFGFTLGILGSLILSLGLVGLFAAVVVPSLTRARVSASETATIARLRTMASAQSAFHDGTCNTYADLEGLLKPATVIPNYPATGPAFLDPEFAQGGALGYRFEFRTEGPVPPSHGCPTRSFGRYEYSASPTTGRGRHFLLTPDGVIHVAENRAATTSDPTLVGASQ